MDYSIWPVFDDVIPDNIIVSGPDYVVPLVAAALVAAVVVGVLFRKRREKNKPAASDGMLFYAA